MKLRKFSSFRGLKKPLRKEKYESETIEILRFWVRRGYKWQWGIVDLSVL